MEQRHPFRFPSDLALGGRAQWARGAPLPPRRLGDELSPFFGVAASRSDRPRDAVVGVNVHNVGLPRGDSRSTDVYRSNDSRVVQILVHVIGPRHAIAERVAGAHDKQSGFTLAWVSAWQRVIERRGPHVMPRHPRSCRRSVSETCHADSLDTVRVQDARRCRRFMYESSIRTGPQPASCCSTRKPFERFRSARGEPYSPVAHDAPRFLRGRLVRAAAHRRPYRQAVPVETEPARC